jgi:GAF domain-containing protein/multidrug resistance efflux pump
MSVAVSDDSPILLDALREDLLRRLIRVSQKFNSTLDIDALLPQVLDLVMETVAAEGGSLWLLEGDTLRCQLARGRTANVLVGLELPLGAGIIGDAVLRRTSVLVREVREDGRFLHQLDELSGFETQSVIAVPLVCRGEVLGGIEVINERSEDGIFEEEHRLFLEALADDAAAAIRNAKLFQAERQARDLAALLEVSREITSTFDLARILVSVVNLAGRAVRFDRCILALWHDDQLRVRAISGEEQVNRKAAEVREIERFLDWAAERGGELFLPNLNDRDGELGAQLDRFSQYMEDSRAQGLFLVPVEDAEGRLGVLHFEFAAPHGLSEWGREAATLLANQTALALRNAQLYADVPFISWLEPLAEKRKALAAIPGRTWMRYAAVAFAVVLVLGVGRVPLRLSASEANIRAAVQQPARAAAAGIVDAVWIQEGQRVEAGTPVARIRDEELWRRMGEAEAGVQIANREELAANARGDAATAAAARVRAVESADALALFRREIGRAQVLAPATGVVLTSRLDEIVGSFVAAGQPVTWIGDPTRVEIELRMRQEDLGDVRIGDRVRARVSAHPMVTFQGRVVTIAPRSEMVAGVPTYAVRAILDNRDGLLLPGMAARAKVVTPSRPLAVFLFRRPWRWVRMSLWW